MISLTTMTMQLIDGYPDGIRICRVEGESLVTVVVPRDKLAQAKSLPNMPHRGVYYLLDESHGVLSRVYAGQTLCGLARLEAHRAKKEFWNKAVMFLDEDYNIDRDVLDALEARAIEYVTSHGSYETDNKDMPRSYLSPFKEERVAHLHESILFRMEVLGYGLNRVDEGPAGGEAVFHTKRNGVVARGRYDKNSGSMLVLAGSNIALNKPIIKNASAIAKREQLFGEQKGVVVLDEDIQFSSPSSAAVFVLGGSQNGWMEWINEAGQTLDEVYRSQEGN